MYPATAVGMRRSCGIRCARVHGLRRATHPRAVPLDRSGPGTGEALDREPAVLPEVLHQPAVGEQLRHHRRQRRERDLSALGEIAHHAGLEVELERVAVGDEVRAVVLSIDWENRRHSLSIRQALPHPWDNIGKYAPGMEISGTVTNIIKSGAFVELEPGIEGFLPVSKMSHTRRVNKPEDAVSIGSPVTVKIIDIDAIEKKISLELLTGEADPWQTDDSSLLDSFFNASVESVRSNGVTARLSNGMLGFIPREECAQPRGTDLQNAYPAGKDVKVVIKSLDKTNRRLTLSESGAIKKEERQEYEKFMKSASSPDESTTFGRLFKKKFDEIQKKGE